MKLEIPIKALIQLDGLSGIKSSQLDGGQTINVLKALRKSLLNDWLEEEFPKEKGTLCVEGGFVCGDDKRHGRLSWDSDLPKLRESSCRETWLWEGIEILIQEVEKAYEI